MKRCKLLIVLILIIVLNYVLYAAENKNISQCGLGFIVDYSMVIVNYKDRKIPIPIYGGGKGSIEEKELIAKYKAEGIIDGDHLVRNILIPVKKGFVKKTYNDILKFYKATLLKDIDIDTPSVIGYEGESPAIIWYDFNYHGVTSSMMLAVRMIEFRGYCDNSIYGEDGEYISISINIGEISPFKNDKDEAYSNWIKNLRKKYPR